MDKPLNAIERQQRLRRSAEPQGQTARPVLALPPVAAQSWQQRAAQAYWQTEREAASAMQIELAARIAALTTRTIRSEWIDVDHVARTATVAVDGVIFRLRGQELILLRPCSQCTVGQFESPAVQTLADLGYVLSTWLPPCVNCQPEDPPHWLYRESADLR